jgi:hypothetical protein
MIILADNNNRMSGGFPHSDIHGSKPVPGSPWLNAGYHVLHRLLLPRHPPNALFALDLIQKEQGRISRSNRSFRVSKAVYLPMPCNPKVAKAVSVLDLEQYRPNRSGSACSTYQIRRTHTRVHQTILMFLSLNDVNSSARKPEGRRASSLTGRSNAPQRALDDHVK